MKDKNIQHQANLIYGVDDNPNLLMKILLGFQHIFAAFGGIIVVPLIIATYIGLGLGITFRPDFISQLPEGLQMVFSSGISTGTIVALILNIVLKDDKNNKIKEDEYLECGVA